MTGADPGFFLGGGVPLRNGVTDFYSEYEEEGRSSQGVGCAPPAPSP